MHESERDARAGAPAVAPPRRDFGCFRCLGGVEDLSSVLARYEVDEVVVALPAQAHADTANLCSLCEQMGVALKLVPDLIVLSLSHVRMDHIAGIPLIDVHRGGTGTWARATNRMLDVAVAGAVLLLISPNTV